MPLDRSFMRLTPAELDEFLTSARTARVGTAGASGRPHVAPLWFVWRDGQLWVNSLRRSKRGAHLEQGSRVCVCVDDGDTYATLRGVLLYGRFADATGHSDLDEVRRAWLDKYWSGIDIPESKAHLWLRLAPSRTVSWDFRKIPADADPRLRAIAAAKQTP